MFGVMWSELLMTSAISCPVWSSVYECQRVECSFTSPVRTDCGILYTVLYVRVNHFIVHGCAVSCAVVFHGCEYAARVMAMLVRATWRCGGAECGACICGWFRYCV